MLSLSRLGQSVPDVFWWFEEEEDFMGGSGSGPRESGKDLVETCRSIDCPTMAAAETARSRKSLSLVLAGSRRDGCCYQRASEDRAGGAHVQSSGPGGNGKTSTSASGLASVRVTMEDSARGSYARRRSVAERSRFCTYPASASCAATAVHWPMQVSERVELNALYAGVRRFARDWEGVRS